MSRRSLVLQLPPDALGEKEFLSRCVKCALCQQTCPTGALQPAISEAGVEGFWTPVVVPRRGGCEFACTRCGEVCPTGAIEPSRCVGCGLCENKCPVGEEAAVRVTSVGETRDPLNRMLLGT
jgi:ferredoxin